MYETTSHITELSNAALPWVEWKIPKELLSIRALITASYDVGESQQKGSRRLKLQDLTF